MPASLAAYTFYKNLVEEKNNYTDIKITELFKDGKKTDFSFKTADLEFVNKNVPKVEHFVQLMKSKDYDIINSLFLDSTLIKVDPDKMRSALIKSDSLYGTINNFQFFGFRFFEKNGIKILHISGALNRQRQGTEFSVELNPSKDNVFYNWDISL